MPDRWPSQVFPKTPMKEYIEIYYSDIGESIFYFNLN